MAYTVITGEFHIHYPDKPRSGPEPDGDTLKFLPDSPLLVERLARAGRPPGFNSRGMINLRFEAIDTLELHFQGAQQNQKFSEEARNVMLDQAGFNQVEFFADSPNKVEAAAPHPVRGYVLARGLDPHGRIIAFVYPGDPPGLDGDTVHATPDTIDGSLNAGVLRAGLAYPSFYSSLPVDLREHLQVVAEQVRVAAMGMWPDATMMNGSWATLHTGDDLAPLVLHPKLFRRFVAYFGAGHAGLGHFDAWIREDSVDRDDFVLLPTGELGNMHDLYEISGDRIRMTVDPEDFVIVPDGVIPAPAPTPPVGGAAVTDRSAVIVAALVDVPTPEAGNETVTLLNPTVDAIDLTGWRIRDAAGTVEPLNGQFAAGEALRVRMAHVRLNNTGDTITLLDSNDGIVDQVAYERRDVPPERHTLIFAR